MSVIKCDCYGERDGSFEQKNANGGETKMLCGHCMRAFCWGFGAGAWKQSEACEIEVKSRGFSLWGPR